MNKKLLRLAYRLSLKLAQLGQSGWFIFKPKSGAGKTIGWRIHCYLVKNHFIPWNER